MGIATCNEREAPKCFDIIKVLNAHHLSADQDAPLLLPRGDQTPLSTSSLIFLRTSSGGGLKKFDF